jgi:hypothetical protein
VFSRSSGDSFAWAPLAANGEIDFGRQREPPLVPAAAAAAPPLQPLQPARLLLLQLLAGLPLFARVPTAFLAQLATRSTAVHAAAGSELCCAGGGPAALFVVLRGGVELQNPHAASPLLVATLGAGGFFGAASLVHGDAQVRHAVGT